MASAQRGISKSTRDWTLFTPPSHFFCPFSPYCLCVVSAQQLVPVHFHLCGRFQVLATGLSGLYSSLPARLQVYSEDWHCLDEADWQQVTDALTPKTTQSLRELDTSLLPFNPQVPALVHFLNSLNFCSAVTKVLVTRHPPPDKRITDS